MTVPKQKYHTVPKQIYIMSSVFARSVSIVAGVAAAATFAAAYMLHNNVLQRTRTNSAAPRYEQRKSPQVIKWADESPGRTLAQEVSFISSDAPLSINF